MTKRELLAKQDYLQKQLADVNRQLEMMETAFSIKDTTKPFSKYSLCEINELYAISPKAYDYLSENRNETILDYNRQSAKDYRVLLEN